jgi:NAD(P)-dependent dehydrogenase (short-subunit alcohol dehydrogenase family)
MTGVVLDMPVGRLGAAEEVVSVVPWPCGEGAGFMVGKALVADGGFTAR